MPHKKHFKKIRDRLNAFLDDKVPAGTKKGRKLRKIISRIKKNSNQKPYFQEFCLNYKFNDCLDEKALKQILDSLQIKPKISIITPVYNTNPTFLKKAIDSVKNQYYTNWQLCICDDSSTKKEVHGILKDESNKNEKILVKFSDKNEGIAATRNKAIELANGEFSLLLDHDDELARNALLEIVKTINKNPDVDFIYSDEDKLIPNGEHMAPFFKPDWSPDLFLCGNYTIHVSVLRTSLLKKIGGFRKGFDGAEDYDLNLRYFEKAKKIIHIPKVLYSWRISSGSTALSISEKEYAIEASKNALKEVLQRRKIDGFCEDGAHMGTYRIRYKIYGNPLVSIIIPTSNLEMLKECISSIIKKTIYQNFEIIVIDGSLDKKIEDFCNKKDIQYYSSDSKKNNFSKDCNFAATKSNGNYLVFLHDDTKIITPAWIEGLLEHAQREEIGAVGTKLLSKDGKILHAGLIGGINGNAESYGGLDKHDAGYFAFARIIRNCSGVSDACMMIKKEFFISVGGFDETLGNYFLDIDLCIRMKKQGKLTLFTPYSILYHYEDHVYDKQINLKNQSSQIFCKKHKDFLEEGDPYYNPNLSLEIPFKKVREP